jgi:hypothetical protein
LAGAEFVEIACTVLASVAKNRKLIRAVENFSANTHRKTLVFQNVEKLIRRFFGGFFTLVPFYQRVCKGLQKVKFYDNCCILWVKKEKLIR